MTERDNKPTGSEASSCAAKVQADAGRDIEGEKFRVEQRGVGPWQGPWPTDPRYDPQYLEHGDRRNVLDEYRYWKLSAIIADLDRRRSPLQVAIENLDHDFNIGSIVRSANAFNAAAVHIVGRRRWNKRGAMVTNKYLHVDHYEDAATFAADMDSAGIPLIGIDIIPGSTPLELAELPEKCVLVFGSEAAGLSASMRQHCRSIHHITQFGSTRSINVGAAAAIAMWAWSVRNRPPCGSVS
ncbi:MAG: TrmH family RNA methyltransferase [Actinomycetaceae bacterium]|nr:TrmH family RNA methyltransferase [Actinomycetaceae bacterium]